MKNTVKFVFLALLASLFVVSAVSAAVLDVAYISSPPTSVSHNAGSFQAIFNVTYTGVASSVNVDLGTSSISNPSGSSISFSQSSFSLSPNQTATVTATISFPANKAGTITGNIFATSSGITTQSLPISVPILSQTSITFTEVTKATPTSNGQLKITNTGNQLVSGSLTPSTSGNVQISVSPSTYSIAAGQSSTFTVTATDVSNIKLGNNGVTVTASNPSTSVTANVYKAFCSNGVVGNNLSVTGIDISSDGDDDTTWKPLDKVTVDVDFENIGSDKVKDVQIELGLFDSAGRKKTGDLDFTNSEEETISYGSLNDGDDDTVTFEFTVPADIDDGSYVIMAKAYSDDDGESNTCSERAPEDVDIEKQDDSGKFIAFDNIVVSPSQATCGDSVTLSFTAYNVGDEDQDKVKIMANSGALNLSQYNEISSFDQGDKQELTYSFIVPAGLQDKTYNIDLDADYDYNKGNYRDGLDHPQSFPIKIFGCTPVASKIASVSAELSSSEAKAGSPVDIRVTITNPTLATATYTLGASGYGSWADSVGLSTKTITLGAGQSKDVTYSFQTKSDAAGEQTFSVDLDSNGKSDSREVSVDIQSGSSLSSLFAGKSTIFWIIVAANVVLVILIIIVAVKLASR